MICNVCKEKKAQSKGYIWRYKTDNFPKQIAPYRGKYWKIQENQIKARTTKILNILNKK